MDRRKILLVIVALAVATLHVFMGRYQLIVLERNAFKFDRLTGRVWVTGGSSFRIIEDAPRDKKQ